MKNPKIKLKNLVYEKDISILQRELLNKSKIIRKSTDEFDLYIKKRKGNDKEYQKSLINKLKKLSSLIDSTLEYIKNF